MILMRRLQQLADTVQIDKRFDYDIVSLHNLSYRHRTLSDTWVGYLFVHLSGYNCIQKLHMGFAKHVHLSGFNSCTKHRAKVRGMNIFSTYPVLTVYRFNWKYANLVAFLASISVCQ